MTTSVPLTSASRPGSRLRAVAAWLVTVVALAFAIGPVAAQDAPSVVVATLDQEALFLNSAFGRRITRELERDRDALTRENRDIEAELIDEERALIDQRAALPAAEFAPLAEAFDTKVERIREEQDRKGRALQVRFEEARQRFLGEIGPILADLLRARGAQVLLDRGAVLLAVEGVDITGAAIAAIDDRLGDGVEGPGVVPRQPDPAPDADVTPDGGSPADLLQPR